jgi:hypothetical protein
MDSFAVRPRNEVLAQLPPPAGRFRFPAEWVRELRKLELGGAAAEDLYPEHRSMMARMGIKDAEGTQGDEYFASLEIAYFVEFGYGFEADYQPPAHWLEAYKGRRPLLTLVK